MLYILRISTVHGEVVLSELFQKCMFMCYMLRFISTSYHNIVKIRPCGIQPANYTIADLSRELEDIQRNWNNPEGVAIAVSVMTLAATSI